MTNSCTNRENNESEKENKDFIQIDLQDSEIDCKDCNDGDVNESSPLIDDIDADNPPTIEEEGVKSFFIDTLNLAKKKKLNVKTLRALRKPLVKFIQVSEKLKGSPYLVSMIVIFCCFGNLWISIIGAIVKVFHLSFITSLLLLHQAFFSLICLVAEISVHSNILGCHGFITSKMAILENVMGRGFLQLFLGALALDSNIGNIQWISAILLHMTGFFNLYWAGLHTYEMKSTLTLLKNTILKEDPPNESVEEPSTSVKPEVS